MIELANNDDGEIEEPNVMLKIDGKTYRCHCGCNVMARLVQKTEGWERYRCNACENEVEAK